MNKVKIPIEVADAIKQLREEGYEDYEILTTRIFPDDSPFSVIDYYIKQYGVAAGNRLIDALVNGYEIE